MTCPNCGHATPPNHAARCGHCNFKLPADNQPQAASNHAVVPCWNCRHDNAAGAERCEQCNAKLRPAPARAIPLTNGQPLPKSERVSF